MHSFARLARLQARVQKPASETEVSQKYGAGQEPPSQGALIRYGPQVQPDSHRSIETTRGRRMVTASANAGPATFPQ
jgi:hypothetical protein